MKLTELVRDPFPDFGEDDEISPAEGEGRRAMREILEDACRPENSGSMPEPILAILRENLAARQATQPN